MAVIVPGEALTIPAVDGWLVKHGRTVLVRAGGPLAGRWPRRVLLVASSNRPSVSELAGGSERAGQELVWCGNGTDFPRVCSEHTMWVRAGCVIGTAEVSSMELHPMLGHVACLRRLVLSFPVRAAGRPVGLGPVRWELRARVWWENR